MAVPNRIAAIDMGSNGIRLTIGDIDRNGAAQEIEYRREAVRLGQDCFAQGYLSPRTMQTTVAAFENFRRRIDKQQVHRVRAVATSATREADNGDKLVRQIRKATGISVEIIDPLEEAQLVYRAVSRQIDLTGRTAVLIEMGGGSVEITVARNGQALGCESFPLGPVRLLQQLEEQSLSERNARKFCKQHRGNVAGLIRAELEDAPAELCIGTGGNIERMEKLRTQMIGQSGFAKIDLSDIDAITDELLAMTVAERIDQLSLRPDRADVIAIAAIVLRTILAEAGISQMLVPGVRLKDGLLRQLAHQIYTEF